MKKVFIGIAVFFAVIVAGVLIFALTFNINKYRPDIEKKLGTELRADVKLERIELSFWPYIGVRIKNVVVKHLPAPQSPFGDMTALTQKELGIQVHAKSLFSGRIIGSLKLQEPSIHLVKTSKGSSLSDLLPAKKEQAAKPTELPSWANRILIETVELSGASFTSIDRTVSPEKVMVIQPIDVKIADIQIADPNRPMDVSLSTKFENIPISLKTPVRFDMNKGEIRVGDGTLKIAGENLGFTSVISGLKDKNILLDGSLTAKALNLENLVSLAKKETQPLPVSGKLDLSARIQGSLESPRLSGSLASDQIKYDAYELNQLKASWEATSKQAKLKQLDFKAFGGTGHTEGTVGLEGRAPYDIAVKLELIDISELAKAMTGRGNVTLQLNGERPAGEDPRKHVNGKGEARLVDGKVETMNLMKSAISDEVMKVVKMALAGRSDVVELPGREIQGTPFREIFFPFTIQNGQLITDKMELDYQDYGALFSGSIGLDQSLDLKGRFLLPPAISAKLIPNEKIRSFLVDEQGKFIVPLQIAGSSMSPHVAPDIGFVQDKASAAVKSLVKEEAQKQLQEQVIPKLQEKIKIPKLPW
ncbi:MAG: AsmA family protein [Deltaproteobacteria bacterium]|nr:AsmA family protein [Deltaproteobacteria bacterium]